MTDHLAVCQKPWLGLHTRSGPWREAAPEGDEPGKRGELAREHDAMVEAWLAVADLLCNRTNRRSILLYS